MSEQRRRLCENMNARLDEIAGRIGQIRDAVSATSMKVARAVQAKLDDAKRRFEMRNARFQKEREQLNSKIKCDLAGAREHIAAWKASRDVEKLSRHAQDAEQHALAAMLIACDAMDEAELAALEALDARLSADAAANERSG